MISLINYGLGNITAIQNVYKRLNIPVCVTDEAKSLARAERIILPGVGAFDAAMHRLNASGMRDVLDELVLEKQVPTLGICVGMQMMATQSEEGRTPGLRWIDAEVKRFSPEFMNPIRGVCLPHMGWNQVKPDKSFDLFHGLKEENKFYFLHSYYFSLKQTEYTSACANYGKNFVAAVQHKNIYGVQFHPEKSHQFGIQLLKNFAEL